MKKDIVKTVKTEVERIIDFETGEVVESSFKSINIVVNPDEFALVYAGFWNVILENPLSKSDVELLGYLIQSYADGTSFTITQHIKDVVSKRSPSNKKGEFKSPTSYNKSTANLIKHKLIVAVGKRTYVINPRYAFKGSSNDRKDAMIKLKQSCPTC